MRRMIIVWVAMIVLVIIMACEWPYPPGYIRPITPAPTEMSSVLYLPIIGGEK